jgi:hypothetical protein
VTPPALALEIGFVLDRRWHWLRGEMEQTKKNALLSLARMLATETVPYALVGGVAVQVHREEPRTTIGIDVAVADRARVPREDLVAAGFRELGGSGHVETWTGPCGTPVLFTDDPLLRDAVARADVVRLDDVDLRVVGIADLLHAKLRAGADAARRRSDRLQDLADAAGLVEARPELEAGLSGEERALLDRMGV